MAIRRKKKKNPEGARGCLFLIFGTLCVIAGMLIYVFAVTRITSVVIEAKYGGQAAYALMKLQLPSIIAAFVLMDTILILKYLPNEEDFEKQDFTSPLKAKKTALGKKKTVNLICIGILGLIVLCGVISVNTYTLVSEDGITGHFFFDTSTHSWDDVVSSRVDCDTEKGLSVTYTMSDGKRFEVLQGTVSDTKALADRYTSTVGLARSVVEKLSGRGVPHNVSHMERAVKFYRYNEPTLWPDVKVMIRFEEILPDDDERVPTDAVTGAVPEP